MQLGRLAVLSRKLHRILLLFTVPLGVIQILTGMTLKYPTFFPYLNFETALTIHLATAALFALAFSLMMFTGLYLYLYPFLQRWLRKPIPEKV